ncbi:MAG: amidase, partial [Clostridiales bacterium]
MAIGNLSVQELAQKMAAGEISSLEATKSYLERIKAIDPYLNSYITITEDTALAAAQASDQRRKEGNCLGALDGIPMALKDIFCTENILTSCASKMLSNFIPPYNATVWNRLSAAGAVLLGKCNMDEFAMGSSTENSFYGVTRNPYDLERVPGGSSGGSASAL